MATDATAPPSSPPNRPRPILLVMLGLTLVVVLWINFGGSGDTGAPPTAARRAQARDRNEAQKLDPVQLDVRLEALAGERPGPGGTERDPFRFKPKPAPPPPPPPIGKPPAGEQGSGPVGPAPPPAPPPITVKYIGHLEMPDGAMLAIFTDCTVGRRSAPVLEGGTINGQYRLVKIGLQSVVVEHLDGRGRTTLPKTGQECVK